jgi:hypothetical protein
VLPGNQHDSQCVAQVQQDLNSWKLGRVVWVMDRGMTSEENRRVLQRAGGQYILGEKLRGNHMSELALSHPGRFKVVADNLHVKQVYVGEGTGRRRYVIAYNPQQAEADRITREQNLERLRCELETLNGKRRKKPECRLLLHPSLSRYVKELKSGKFKIDLAKVKQEESLDGKFLLSTSDESLSVEDIALGYQAALGSGARLPDVEKQPVAAAGVPLQGRSHPLPCADLLAGAASGAHRRGGDRDELGGGPAHDAAASSWRIFE